MSAEVGGYHLDQITVLSRESIYVSHPFPAFSGHVRRQALRLGIHVGKTSLNVILEKNRISQVLPFTFRTTLIERLGMVTHDPTAYCSRCLGELFVGGTKFRG